MLYPKLKSSVLVGQAVDLTYRASAGSSPFSQIATQLSAASPRSIGPADDLLDIEKSTRRAATAGSHRRGTMAARL
jgi:hypothetical protein